jgi:uncharacterized RDD family membrane protein YckC
MKTMTISSWYKTFLRVALLTVAGLTLAWSQETPPAPEPEEAPTVEAPSAPTEPDVELESDEVPAAPDAPEPDESDDFDRHHVHGGGIVRVGADAHLPADQVADAVVSVFGSSTSEGEVRDAVTSIFGDTRVTGPVGDVAVAVFGNTYVDSRVRGDAVAVFGNLELGPNAVIEGEAVVVGGILKRHPGAVVHGPIEEVSFAGEFGQFRWLRPWIEHCLLLGRPLALEPGLEWAWWLAFGFLGFYVLCALLFAPAVEKCVNTLETRPGETTIASLVTVFLSPLVVILLSITVIGVILVPFFALGLFVAGLFGKAVVFAALGRRVTRYFESGVMTNMAVAVLIGGLLVTAIYLVPFLGFIAYKLLGILGLGVVVYTLLLAIRARPPRAATAAAGAGATTMSMDAAAPLHDANGVASEAAPQPSSETTPPVPPTALPRAHFWIRIGALAIDAVLVGIIANLVPGSGDIWLLALATYGAVMWKLKGTTVGGVICNLRVVRVDGREIDWATAIVRALGCFLSAAAVCLGFIWIAIDPERQGWHDKIAGTIVVRTPKAGSLV